MYVYMRVTQSRRCQGRNHMAYVYTWSITVYIYHRQVVGVFLDHVV
jgi:hypothetical protein